LKARDEGLGRTGKTAANRRGTMTRIQILGISPETVEGFVKQALPQVDRRTRRMGVA